MTPAREAVRRLVAEGALTLSASGRISTPNLSVERIEELAGARISAIGVGPGRDQTIVRHTMA